MGTRKFSRGQALTTGASSLSSDSLMFFTDVDMVFSFDTLQRIRLNTILGAQVKINKVLLYLLFRFTFRLSFPSSLLNFGQLQTELIQVILILVNSADISDILVTDLFPSTDAILTILVVLIFQFKDGDLKMWTCLRNVCHQIT
jgi:hypothetical protein